MSVREQVSNPRSPLPGEESEPIDANVSDSPSSDDSRPSRPMILYQPPTIWSIFRGAAINVFLPFINGLMLGFGELFAHEAAYRLGWGGTKVFPSHRNSHSIGPGVEVQGDYMERRRRGGGELDDLMSLE